MIARVLRTMAAIRGLLGRRRIEREMLEELRQPCYSWRNARTGSSAIARDAG